MASATKSAKPRSRAAQTKAKRQRSGKPTNGKVKGAGPGKFAPNQPPLEAMKDVDERIPALDEECQRYFANKDKQIAGREGMEESLDKVGELLKENNLDCYILNGKKFYIEPGSPSVKCVKVKQKG